MQWRNATDNSDGSYDCEVLMNGEWLPFRAMSDDPETHGRQIWSEIDTAPAEAWSLGILVSLEFAISVGV